MERDKVVMRRLYGLLLAGLFLLFNPNVNLVDPLPDAIAYLLLMHALNGAAELFPYFSEARDGFRKLIWINLSKLPAIFLLILIVGGDISQRSLLAVFSLSFGILELVFAIPAFQSLFRAFYYLGERYGCSCCIMPIPVAGRSRLHFRKSEAQRRIAAGKSARPRRFHSSGFFLRLTVLFLLVRTACSFIPDLFLTPVSDTGTTEQGFEVTRLYPLMLALCILVAFVFGIYWFCSVRRYICRMRRNAYCTQLYLDALHEHKEQLQNKNSYMRLTAGAAFLALGAGLSIDLLFDHQNILPDLFSALALLCAVLFLRPYLPKKLFTPAVVLISVYGAVSVVCSVAEQRFISTYGYESLTRVPAADAAYGIYMNLNLAEDLLLCAALVLCCFLLMQMNRQICGLRTADPFRSRQASERRKALNLRVLLFTGAGILSAVSTYAYVILMQFSQEIEMQPGYTGSVIETFSTYGWFWVVRVCASLVWLCIAISYYMSVREEASLRFLDDD